jgi:hypothetical protein
LHYIDSALTVHDLFDWKSAKENWNLGFLHESHPYSYKANALLMETGNKLCAHPLTKNLEHLMLKLWNVLLIQKYVILKM